MHLFDVRHTCLLRAGLLTVLCLSSDVHHLASFLFAMELFLPQVVRFVVHREIRLSFTIPDVFLPLDSAIIRIPEELAAPNQPYFHDHDGVDIGFGLQEDRVLTNLGGFRHLSPPTTTHIFRRLSRFGHKAFVYGTDLSLVALTQFAAVSSTWYRICAQVVRGSEFLMISRLVHISVRWNIEFEEIDDDQFRYTGEFSGRISRLLALGTVRLPLAL